LSLDEIRLVKLPLFLGQNFMMTQSTSLLIIIKSWLSSRELHPDFFERSYAEVMAWTKSHEFISLFKNNNEHWKIWLSEFNRNHAIRKKLTNYIRLCRNSPDQTLKKEQLDKVLSELHELFLKFDHDDKQLKYHYSLTSLKRGEFDVFDDESEKEHLTNAQCRDLVIEMIDASRLAVFELNRLMYNLKVEIQNSHLDPLSLMELDKLIKTRNTHALYDYFDDFRGTWLNMICDDYIAMNDLDSLAYVKSLFEGDEPRFCPFKQDSENLKKPAVSSLLTHPVNYEMLGRAGMLDVSFSGDLSQAEFACGKIISTNSLEFRAYLFGCHCYFNALDKASIYRKLSTLENNGNLNILISKISKIPGYCLPNSLKIHFLKNDIVSMFSAVCKQAEEQQLSFASVCTQLAEQESELKQMQKLFKSLKLEQSIGTGQAETVSNQVKQRI